MIINVISLALIVLCVMGIARIVARYTSVLASIDIETIPEERHAAVKEALILNRFRRKLYSFKALAAIVSEPLRASVRTFKEQARSFHALLLAMKSEYKSKTTIGGASVSLASSVSPEEQCDRRIAQAARLFDEGKLGDAEREYISAIALEQKCIPAYEGLKNVYSEQKQWLEASEVVQCLLRLYGNALKKDEGAEADALSRHIAETSYDLTEIQMTLGKLDDSLKAIKKALKYQENNPKYIHTLIDVHVARGERLKAETALDRLREVNPENQKLEEIQERIAELAY